MNTDIIRLLPDSVANQIAAGEVIQRPASVIKELVENSVDSGADAITIVLKDAGRTLIQVIDNGCGMSPGDARMAFERHATSKISSAQDLYSLHTMGFRGEALPSIAAVSQIELRTMRKEDTMGTRLTLSESRFEGAEPCTGVPGTNMSVKNLFFHMPARRKFLKKDSVELNHIQREFERLALVNTDIDFTLIHNDVTLHQFARGTLKQRIGALFGKHLESLLAPIATETSLVRISGFIGMPRSAKRRGYQQFMFVNGRNMRHPFFHKAIIKCYEQLIPADTQPSYFVSFDVDPSTIDVNIHPQKHEIKFEHEQAIWQILEAAVRETLGRTQAAGALDFDSDDAPEIPLFNPSDTPEVPGVTYDENFNPFAVGDSSPRAAHPQPAQWERRSVESVPRDWEKLYENFNRERDDAFSAPVPAQQSASPVVDDSAMSALFDGYDGAGAAGASTDGCFQLDGRYIVCKSQSGLMVVSQHRAHVRILYDRFMRQLADGSLPSQQLIFGEKLDLPPVYPTLSEALLERLHHLGFAIGHDEEGGWVMTAAPTLLGNANPQAALLNLLEEVTAEEILDEKAFMSPVALSMARSASIPNGRLLTPAEMEAIIADLFRCIEPSFTPDGNNILTVIGTEEIRKRFF